MMEGQYGPKLQRIFDDALNAGEAMRLQMVDSGSTDDWDEILYEVEYQVDSAEIALELLLENPSLMTSEANRCAGDKNLTVAVTCLIAEIAIAAYRTAKGAN